MRTALIVLVTTILLGLGAAAAALAWNEPQAPPVLASVANALDVVDFGDLPPKQTFAARDTTQLVFRGYSGTGADTVVLIHGATFTSASMHAVARALHARGATVYSLSVRGHDDTGRNGDIDYVGQLEDDLEDFVKSLGPKRPGERRALLGFSAGGGLALRFAGDARASAFDRFILVAPLLNQVADVLRPDAGGFVSVAIPRILVLQLLFAVGVNACGDKPIVAFAVLPDGQHSKTQRYSCRMDVNFEAGEGFLEHIRHAPGPASLLVGSADEIFFADRYAPLLRPARPDLDVTILPGLNHMDMIVKPTALETLADKTLGRKLQ